MKWANLRIEADSFRSKVARRIFLLFVLCAFVPMIALAFISLSRVSDHLEALAGQELRQLTKSTGMSIYERFQFLAGELKLYGDRLGLPPSLGTAGTAARVAGFRNAHFGKIAIRPVPLPGRPAGGARDPAWAPGPEEWAHLRAGGTVLRQGEPAGTIEMIRLARSREGRDVIVAGEVDPGYLFAAAGALPAGRSLFLVNAAGAAIFSSFPGPLPISSLRGALRRYPATGEFRFARAGDDFLASYWTIFTRPQFLATGWVVVGVQSRQEVLEPIREYRRLFLLVALLSFWGILLLSFAQIRRILIPIALLKEATRRIGRRDLQGRVHIHSGDEFEDLGGSFNEMVQRIGDHLRVMQTVNQIGISLSSTGDSRRILEIVLRGARLILRADGAALYVPDEGKTLRPAVIEIESLGLLAGSWQPNSARQEAERERSPYDALAARAAATGEAINVRDIHAADEWRDEEAHAWDRAIGFRGQSVLTVPLRDDDGDLIAVIQLTNARDRRSGATTEFSGEDERLLASLASQGAVAFQKNRLVGDFKLLFESLIDLIVTAIDEKSPHTGNHCKRVPILAMMLADAACKSEHGRLKEFALSQKELYELKVAALLHDCGKVTTPVHVMDKSTKLEKLFDRIALVETRCEVVRAEMQTAFLRERLGARGTESEDDVREAERGLEARIRELYEDREIIRRCNPGSEGMDPALADRVREIAGKYRCAGPDGEASPILTDEEVRNLVIVRGTLTPEERQIINYHIVATTKMLEGLPYPKYLRNVPRYAGAHHERLNGQGYPGGLRGEEIPMQARILAVADIFEALTAEDRPYRERTTLAGALRTLRALADQGQIDSDLVDVLIQEKVFLRYAERHLDPEQIDEEFLSELEGQHP